jgi:hypothetical protein
MTSAAIIETENNALRAASGRGNQFSAFAQQLAICKNTPNCDVKSVYAYWSNIARENQAEDAKAIQGVLNEGTPEAMRAAGIALGNAVLARMVNPLSICDASDAQCIGFVQEQNRQANNIYQTAIGLAMNADAIGTLGRVSNPQILEVMAGTPKGLNILRQALDEAVPTTGHPSQLMTTLPDGTKILFRKDFGDNAHPIGGPFQGSGDINHYNIQVQLPNGRSVQNLHVVPNGNGGFVWWGNNGIVRP